jgi:hypothetical protein
MRLTGNVWKTLASPWCNGSSTTTRGPRRAELAWDCLEERTVLSHIGGFHHHAHATASSISGSRSTGSTTTSTGTTATNTTLTAAQQTLHNDVLSIEKNSSTTVGQLATIRSAFETLEADGLNPSSQSALSSFENSLVTTYASSGSGAITGNATLLAQFEALYTSAPTTQQAMDLTAAYNALTSAVSYSNITSANIAAINTDYAAVLAAEGSTSTSTFPYFSLVTGGYGGPGGGCH